MKSLVANGFLVTLILLACTGGLLGQTLRSTITFDNQSGEPAMVKLVGQGPPAKCSRFKPARSGR